jgi:hypothetical protein
MCKKQIQNARRNINYFTEKDKSLCVPCHREFILEVDSIMDEAGGSQRNSVKYENYSFKTYKEVLADTLEELSK